MRARMALLLNKVQVQLREVVLKDKPPSLLDFSAKGTVPVLVISEQLIIDESREILDWAIQQAENPAFDLPCRDQQSLVAHNDNQFKGILDQYKYFDRHPQQPQQEYRRQGEVFLALLEQRLIHCQYLFSPQIGYADIAIFPFIRQFANVDRKWFDQADYPQLQAWLARLIDSEAFGQVMTPFKQWHAGDDLIHFPKD